MVFPNGNNYPPIDISVVVYTMIEIKCSLKAIWICNMYIMFGLKMQQCIRDVCSNWERFRNSEYHSRVLEFSRHLEKRHSNILWTYIINASSSRPTTRYVHFIPECKPEIDVTCGLHIGYHRRRMVTEDVKHESLVFNSPPVTLIFNVGYSHQCA